MLASAGPDYHSFFSAIKTRLGSLFFSYHGRIRGRINHHKKEWSSEFQLQSPMQEYNSLLLYLQVTSLLLLLQLWLWVHSKSRISTGLYHCKKWSSQFQLQLLMKDQNSLLLYLQVTSLLLLLQLWLWVGQYKRPIIMYCHNYAAKLYYIYSIIH